MLVLNDKVTKFHNCLIWYKTINGKVTNEVESVTLEVGSILTNATGKSHTLDIVKSFKTIKEADEFIFVSRLTGIMWTQLSNK